MADFSKQWCDQNDPGGIQPDFDVIEEFRKLEENTYVPMICEGYGFGAIANINGECKVMMDREWIDFDYVVNNYRMM